jgi:hypothetical protein
MTRAAADDIYIRVCRAGAYMRVVTGGTGLAVVHMIQIQNSLTIVYI